MPQENIPLSSPDITEGDIAAVTDVLRTRHLSLGPTVVAFEEAFASFVGTKHAVAVNSGTSALHLAMLALDLRDGAEVITTPFSFIASSNCILFERARPVFVDILPDTLCIDPAQVERAITAKTKAILAVDVFGYLCDWDALRSIAAKHRLALVEDSCEALGSERNGKRAGTFGDCAVFGFYPNKQMTTGEGGMLVTDRDDIAHIARSLRNQGRDDAGAFLEHNRLGFNYRLSDINCALGLSQLGRLLDFRARRAQVVQWYAQALAALGTDVVVPVVQEGVDTSWFVYVVRLQQRYSKQQRDAVISFLQRQGIGCNVYFPAIHLQPLYREMFGYHEGVFPVTEAITERTIALPFSSKMTQEEVAIVAGALQEALRQLS